MPPLLDALKHHRYLIAWEKVANPIQEARIFHKFTSIRVEQLRNQQPAFCWDSYWRPCVVVKCVFELWLHMLGRVHSNLRGYTMFWKILNSTSRPATVIYYYKVTAIKKSRQNPAGQQISKCKCADIDKATQYVLLISTTLGTHWTLVGIFSIPLSPKEKITLTITGHLIS